FGWGQRRTVAAWHWQGRCGARHGSGEAGIDYATHEIQGRDLRADQGRRWTPYAVLQGLSATVLLPHDRRDGSGRAAERHGDGDAWRQCGIDDRTDYAGGHGKGLTLRHPRRWQNGR